MNSRERVLASLSHQQPDRVPVDCNAHRSSGMAVQAYKNLREYLGLPKSELYLYDVIQQLVIIEDDVLDYFNIDVVQLGYEYYKDPNYWKNWTHHNGETYKIPKYIDIQKNANGDFVLYGDFDNVIAKMPKDGLYFGQTYYAYADSEDEEFNDLELQLNQNVWWRIGCPPSPNGFDEEGLRIRRENAKELRNSTTRAIYGIFGGSLLEVGQQTFRMDNFLMEMAANEERVEKFLDKLLEIHMRNLALYLDSVGDYIDIIGFSDDLGMQTGSMFSIEMFCKYFKPRYAKMWNYIKLRYPNMKICMHSCGGIFTIIPHLVEIGLDAINPVQITCKGMEPAKLKEKYGDTMVFWGGGCDTRYVLSFGTTEEVRENVKENVAAFKPSGGFIFQQVHNMLANVPPQNIVAMYDAVKEFGKYHK